VFLGGQVEIGIVGFGRFGRFVAEVLKKDFAITAYDPKIRRHPGVRFRPLAETASKTLVILFVPISQIGETCMRIRSLLSPGQLVIDTCSVKEEPLRRMKKILPRSVELLGTHPLFGPDSAQAGLKGLTVVLCPVRCKRIGRIKRYLLSRGLKVIIANARDHDLQMANTQALFHFLARAIFESGIRIGRFSTPGPTRLFADLEHVQKDSFLLFRDLQTHNRFSAGARRRLLRHLTRLDARLKNS
jgi:prephenate dehydrogenase